MYYVYQHIHTLLLFHISSWKQANVPQQQDAWNIACLHNEMLHRTEMNKLLAHKQHGCVSQTEYVKNRQDSSVSKGSYP